MRSIVHSYGPKFGLVCLMAVMLLSAMPGVSQNATAGLLVTGKYITLPPLGTQLTVGSLPMNTILSPDGQYALVSDMGFDQWLTAINAGTGAFVSNVAYPNCNYCEEQTTNGLYYGLAFGNADMLYAAQGGNNTIYRGAGSFFILGRSSWKGWDYEVM